MAAWGVGGTHSNSVRIERLCPSHITQQWCFASIVIWTSFRSVPGCRDPHSCSLLLSLQVLSPGLLSKPHEQYPAPGHSNRHLSQAGECRAVVQNICVDLTLACLPQTLVASLPSDSPQISPFVPTVLFTYEGASPGAQVPSHFFFFSPFFLFHLLIT